MSKLPFVPVSRNDKPSCPNCHTRAKHHYTFTPLYGPRDSQEKPRGTYYRQSKIGWKCPSCSTQWQESAR